VNPAIRITEFVVFCLPFIKILAVLGILVGLKSRSNRLSSMAISSPAQRPNCRDPLSRYTQSSLNRSKTGVPKPRMRLMPTTCSYQRSSRARNRASGQWWSRIICNQRRFGRAFLRSRMGNATSTANPSSGSGFTLSGIRSHHGSWQTGKTLKLSGPCSGGRTSTCLPTTRTVSSPTNSKLKALC
jgi:hypothetical protein